ncbi:MAG: molybdopterin-guanine dinucleotide biosynthesis protein B [Planctomycetaceae bacterium]|nr:molybdopterin-guanine dinucleotide biosynthesis protein B [Planctomycetaceae bacterium]
MKRIHIIGGKNQGKTTLVVELIREFRQRKMKVASIKHTHHEHELDVPGKDSHQHRTAGAAAVGIVSQGLNAVFWESAQLPDNKPYDMLESFMSDCDLILVEGDTRADAPKIEVWRNYGQKAPLASTDPSIQLVVTDEDISIETKVLRRSQVASIADWITKLLEH